MTPACCDNDGAACVAPAVWCEIHTTHSDGGTCLLGWNLRTCDCVACHCRQMMGDPILATIPAPKHRVMVFDCASRDLMTALYFAKAADVVVVVINVAHGEESTYDEAGSLFLTAFKAQGMPSVVGLVQGLDLLPQKRASEMKRYSQRCAPYCCSCRSCCRSRRLRHPPHR